MPYPAAYTRQFNFQDDQIEHPSDKTPGQSLDAEFNAVKIASDATQARLAMIQRSDGQLANGSVGNDQLSATISTGFQFRGAWQAGQTYIVADSVSYGPKIYRCNVKNGSTNVNRPDVDSTTWSVATDFSALVSQISAAQHTNVNDTSYTILTTDRTVAYTALTAARVLTLPAASAFPAGVLLTILDESGSCNGTRTITINRAGSDSLAGGTNYVLNSAREFVILESDGSSKWTIVSQSLVKVTVDYSFTQSGTGAVSRTHATRSRDFITIKDFAGDSYSFGTDDTSVMQAFVNRCVAINAVGVLLPGTYVCDTITVSDTCKLIGSGWQTVVAPKTLAQTKIFDVTGSHVILEDFTIWGQHLYSEGVTWANADAIVVSGANSQIRNINVGYVGSAVKLKANSQHLVESGYWTRLKNGGLYIGGFGSSVGDSRVVGTIIATDFPDGSASPDAYKGTAIAIDSGANAIEFFRVRTAGTQTGVTISDSTAAQPENISFDQCNIDAPYSYAMIVNSCKRLRVTNSDFRSYHNVGVYFGTVYGLSFISNVVTGCYQDGVDLSSGVADAEIHSNKICCNSGGGAGVSDDLVIDNALRVSVIGNRFGTGTFGYSQTSRYGVRISASSTGLMKDNIFQGGSGVSNSATMSNFAIQGNTGSTAPQDNIPYFYGILNSTYTCSANNQAIPIPVVTDTASAWGGSAYTVGRAGLYEVEACALMATTSPVDVTVIISKNGSTLTSGFAAVALAADYPSAVTKYVGRFSAGDTISFLCAANTAKIFGDGAKGFFSIRWLAP